MLEPAFYIPERIAAEQLLTPRLLFMGEEYPASKILAMLVSAHLRGFADGAASGIVPGTPYDEERFRAMMDQARGRASEVLKLFTDAALSND